MRKLLPVARVAERKGYAELTVAGCFDVYLSALQSAFDRIAEWRPDLVLYQAGADPRQGSHSG